MDATDAAEFGRVFGPYSAALHDTTRRRSLAPVGGAVLSEEPWVSRFHAAGRHPTFVAVQWALDVARILNIRTERAMTLFFDRNVHQGPTAVRTAASASARAWPHRGRGTCTRPRWDGRERSSTTRRCRTRCCQRKPSDQRRAVTTRNASTASGSLGKW